VEAARHNGHLELAAELKANEALRNAELGYSAEAKADINEALALDEGFTVRVMAAMVLARLGEGSHARQMADELDRERPKATLVQFYLMPSIRAAIELDSGHAARAVELLQATTPYELGDADVSTANYGNLFPIYLRGLAFLQLERADLASAQFKKMLDHPGVTTNYIVAPLARLNLARSLAMAGDTQRARQCYEDLFAIWKDADPEIPVFKAAKAEYSALSQQHS